MQDSGHIPVWTDQRVQRTNSRGRHIYCESFKTWIIEQAIKPGMSMAGLAMHNRDNANQRRWVQLHRRLEGGVRMPRHLPFSVAPEHVVTESRAASGIEIEINGAVVRVRHGVDAEALDALRGQAR
uniref:hypothetical protein n=1 Tax=Variovorax sp. BK018 TaxID=3450241 RepID=UPI00403A1F93